MTKITQEEGLKISKISCIGLRDYELLPLIEKLEQVLSYAERINQVVSEAQGLSTKLVNVMRSDNVISTKTEPLLACAPEREGNYFVVQAILDTK